jgi:hypothetical protein
MFGRIEAVRAGGLEVSVEADDGMEWGRLLAPMAPVPTPLLVLVPANILGRMDADRVDDVVTLEGTTSALTAVAGATLIANAA